MGKKYSTDFIGDHSESTGSANQVLISTTSGVSWVDGSGSAIIGGPYVTIGTDQTVTGIKSFSGKIGADGGIDGLTLANGGISGSNYDITGVNSITINDPGEGIIFTGTATMLLNAVDDATDSILKLTNATQLNLNSTARITSLVNPIGAQDAATKNYVDSEIGNIPAGLAFEGNWNASTDDPTLSGTTPDNGKFWIVTVAGATDLSGITDWAVGDWAIYVDNGAGTDAWQKVDNSSTLSGLGSAGKVALWSSTSNVSFNSNLLYDGTYLTTPRVRVGDGTDGYFYSDTAGRTAFAGGTFYIQNSVPNYYNYATNIHLGATTGDNVLFRGSTITGTSWGITPTGVVTAGGGFLVPYTAATKKPMINLAGATNYGLWHTEGSDDIFSFDFGGVSKQQFFQSGNATFVGDVTATTFLGNSTTQTAGNNSTLIATTAYADAAAGAVPIGNYVTLATAQTISGVKTFSANNIHSDNSHITFGPNSSWSSYLRVGGNGHTATGTEMASIATTNGNLHLDSADDASGMYLNFYAGTGGIKFGNGAAGVVATMTSAGALSMDGDLTVSGGDITLGGTGRIQGVDTVTDGTDAANKAYVDTKLSLAGGTMANTNLVTNMNADLLDGKDHTAFGATLATYGTTAGASGRIRITAPFNTNSGHMFQITVSIYSSYTIHTYVVGGYMYSSTNNWYASQAVYSGTGSPDIVVGRDGNGKAYISIANGNYTGVRVHNMTRGYQTSVADTYDPWTISITGGTENSITPSIYKTWNSGNDGAGSGLDADLLDGQQGSYYASAASLGDYVTLATAQTITGAKTIDTLKIGSANKIQFANNDFIRYEDATGVGRFHFDSDGGTNNSSVQAATFVGALSGNATTATTATTSNLIKVNDYSGATDMRILGSHQTGGSDTVYSNASMYLNCDTGIINATGFVGALTGNATSATSLYHSFNRTDTASYPVVWMTASSTSQAYSCAAVTITSSAGRINATTFNGALTGNVTGNASGVSETGYGSDNFTFWQTSGAFAGYSGWANYFIGNHGNGSTYYNTVHIMPFWGAPKYSRLEGGTQTAVYDYWTSENHTPSNYLPLVGGAMTGNIQMNSQIFATAGNYGRGVFGLYNASKYQHVWSMGTAYKLADNGASTGTGGNLYGLAWSYNPDHGGAGNNAQSKPGLQHQLLLMMNGTTKFAAGNGMWTSGNATIEGTMIANQISLKSGASEYLAVSSYSGSSYIYGSSSGSTIYFGQPATWAQNIQVSGDARISGRLAVNTSTVVGSAINVEVPITNSGVGSDFRISTGSGYGMRNLSVEIPGYGSGIKIYSPSSSSVDNGAMTFVNNGSTVGSINLNTSSTSYTTTSDYRLKENRENILDAIERVKELKPIKFNWIKEPGEAKVDGFYAHELAEVVPEAVTGKKDALDWEGNPAYQSIDQAKIVPLLTAALQQAIDKIEALELRINKLEKQ